MNEFFKKPVVKILMLKGEKGDKGNTGAGTPTGGKTGQYLLKKSDADYDYVWSPITTVSWDNVSGKPDAYPTTWEKVTGKQWATTSTSGLMSTEDKSKLDNLKVVGRNLLIVSQSQKGFAYVSDGSIAPIIDSAAMVEYISVIPSEKLTFSRKAGSGDIFRFNCYDNDKNFISRSYVPGLEGAELSYVYTVPDNVYYIKVSYPCDGTSQAKLERGTVATEWAPAPEDVENVIEAVNSVTKSFTLSASSWSSGSYTISDGLITATSNQEILPATNITADQMKALQKANIIDSGQSAGSLTLKALGTVPSIDIPIRIIFRGKI